MRDNSAQNGYFLCRRPLFLFFSLYFFCFFAPHSPHDQTLLGLACGIPSSNRERNRASTHIHTQTQTKTPHTTEKTTLTIVVCLCADKKIRKDEVEVEVDPYALFIQEQLNTLTNVSATSVLLSHLLDDEHSLWMGATWKIKKAERARKRNRLPRMGPFSFLLWIVAREPPKQQKIAQIHT